MKCCWFCGDTEDLTDHHAKHHLGKRVKKGIIILCRDCHTWVHIMDRGIKACKRGQMSEKVFLRTVTAFADSTQRSDK